MIEQATKEKPGTCPDCNADVLTFTDTHGRPVRLDDHDLPMTVDTFHPSVRHRLWNYLGPRLGWAPQFSPARSWQPMRIEHRCDDLNTHKNKKETEQ